MPSLATARTRQLGAELRIREARGDQLVEAVLLGGMELEEPERREPRHLHRADLDVLDAVPLGVEERIRDPERHLVTQVRRAKRVGEHQDVWHAPDSN